jgi:hypothetical protein
MKKYIFIFVILIACAFLVSWKWQWYIAPPALFVITLIHRDAFQVIFQWKFLLFLFLILFGIPLFLGDKNASVLGIWYSSEYFQKSTVMINRSLIILLSIRMITGKMSPEQVSNVFKKMRLKNFSEVYSIAITVLPDLNTIARESFRHASSPPQKSHILKRFYEKIVNMMVGTLGLADQYYRDQNFQGKKH